MIQHISISYKLIYYIIDKYIKYICFIISFVVDRSDEYPTTMMPVLTTPRETRAFDFVPVNIIRDDGKETSFRERNFGDFSDVSLVPAGTNSRIQVRTSTVWL